jgi:hypothetical protein
MIKLCLLQWSFSTIRKKSGLFFVIKISWIFEELLTGVIFSLKLYIISWILFSWRGHSSCFRNKYITFLNAKKHSSGSEYITLLPSAIFVNQMAVLVYFTININWNKTGALSRNSRHIVLTICEAHTMSTNLTSEILKICICEESKDHIEIWSSHEYLVWRF